MKLGRTWALTNAAGFEVSMIWNREEEKKPTI